VLLVLLGMQIPIDVVVIEELLYLSHSPFHFAEQECTALPSASGAPVEFFNTTIPDTRIAGQFRRPADCRAQQHLK
jgi:hypothetical protein